MEELLHAARNFYPECPARVLDGFLRLAALPTQEILALPMFKIREKQYGRYYIVEQHECWALSYAYLNPRRAMSHHVHRKREELIYVRCGTLKMTLNDEQCFVAAGGFINSSSGVAHRVENGSDELLEIVELVVPPLWEDKEVISAGW